MKPTYPQALSRRKSGDNMTFLSAFKDELHRQRWDDHRLYHQSRINQTLHLISAVSFLCAYALVLKDPLMAVLVGWCVGMVTRQTGHYVFEPASYDEINRVTNDHKEQVKVGFNQKRKTVLIALVLAAPLTLHLEPTLFGLMEHATGWRDFGEHVAILWLGLAALAVAARCLQLCVTRTPLTGLVWVYKIATDPLHNIRIYWKSPLYLLQGQLYDPLDDAGQHGHESGATS